MCIKNSVSRGGDASSRSGQHLPLPSSRLKQQHEIRDVQEQDEKGQHPFEESQALVVSSFSSNEINQMQQWNTALLFAQLLACVLVSALIFLLFDQARHTSERAGAGSWNNNITEGGKGVQRPIAIIHIGPRKTASTALQYVFNDDATRQYLKQDNFVYVGKRGGKNRYWSDFIADCVEGRNDLSDECRVDERWANFAARLDKRKEENTNIIISEEGFLRFFGHNEAALDLLADTLQGWEVRIVAVYRRYYSWLLSEYAQEIKPRTDLHPKRNFNRIVPFPEWYRNQMNEENRSKLYFPLDAEVLDLWKSRFEQVEVFNMHNKNEDARKNLIERFLCDIIREAPATCEAAKDGKLPISTEQNIAPSPLELDAETLAVYIQKQKIVPPWTPLDELVPALTKFLNDTQTVVPRNCLNDEDLNDILLKTLKIEQDLVPDFASANGEIDTVSEVFRQAVSDNKFCGIRFDLIHGQSEWKSFFDQLRNDLFELDEVRRRQEQ